MQEKDRNTKEIRLDQMNSLVRYSNEVNDQDLFSIVDTYTEKVNNMFIAVIAQVQSHDEAKVHFSSEQLRSIIGYNKNISNAEFAELVQKAFKEMGKIQLDYEEVLEDGTLDKTTALLFSTATVNVDRLECSIKVNQPFVYLFNNLSRWTRFSLSQYVNIRSNYAKKLFRFLKQYRTVGKKTFKVEEFKQQLGIPASYQMSQLKERILDVAMEELAPYFKNLTLTKKKQGRTIVAFTFSFNAEERNQKSESYLPSSLIGETIHLFNIQMNHYLTNKQKNRSIDRLLSYKLGTTAAFVKKNAPESLFPIAKKKSKKGFIRGDLDEVYDYPLSRLIELVEVYERINSNGLLQEADITDLIKLELILLDKESRKIYRSVLSSAEDNKAYEPNSGLIGSEIAKKRIFINKKDFSIGHEKEIEELVKAQEGKNFEVVDKKRKKTKTSTNNPDYKQESLSLDLFD